MRCICKSGSIINASLIAFNYIAFSFKTNSKEQQSWRTHILLFQNLLRSYSNQVSAILA